MDISTLDCSGMVRQLSEEEIIMMKEYNIVGFRVVLREENIIPNVK